MIGAERLTISIGDTPAIPATRISPPQSGELNRPKEPDITARYPREGMVIPNCWACGVTASLNAKAAASPEPVRAPRTKGPTEPPILAQAFEVVRAWTRRSIRPEALRPAAKTPAAMMMPRMLPYPFPYHQKIFLIPQQDWHG